MTLVHVHQPSEAKRYKYTATGDQYWILPEFTCAISRRDNIMARMITRMKHQVTQIRLSRLVASVILFGLLVAAYKILQSGPFSRPKKQMFQPDRHNPSMNELDAQLQVIQDTRPSSCRTKTYPSYQNVDVSIIFTYYNNEFYELKLTLESFIAHTPKSTYTEVLILDDGSDRPEIKSEVAQYLRTRDFGRLKLLRSESRDGEAASRFKASKAASGSIFVFASSRTIFNKGWLEPLKNYVLYNPESIAMPHVDNFLRGHKFFPLSDKLINVFSLTLSTIHLESPETIAEDGNLMSPVMRGDVFAVVREYYESLGEHDDSFKDGGGHDLELSLRAWLCGGEIKIVLCSRVAVVDALKPIDVEEPRNARRLAELWLGSYKSAMYRQRDDFVPQMETEESHLLRARNVYLHKKLQCKTIDWYLSNVALDMIIPSDDFIHFGKFRDRSGYCMKNDNGQLVMVHCQAMMYETETLFELTVKGTLSNALMCLSAKSAEDIYLLPCQKGVSDKEVWSLNQKQQIQNQAFSGLCLEHVTGGKSSLELKQCSQNDMIPRQHWTVIKY